MHFLFPLKFNLRASTAELVVRPLEGLMVGDLKYSHANKYFSLQKLA
jgi:hypothetical protein